MVWFPVDPVIDLAYNLRYGVCDAEEYEVFGSRWGTLDLSAFQRALEAGDEDERVLALLVIGLIGTPSAADCITPFLSSPRRRERCASAHCLGVMQDTRAFPVLQRQILDTLSVNERHVAYEQATSGHDETLADELRWCASYRADFVFLLEPVVSSAVLALFRQAVEALLQVEQAGYLYPGEDASYDALAYALGRWNDHTLFTEVALPPPHRQLALVSFAQGYLQRKLPFSDRASRDVREKRWVDLDPQLFQDIEVFLGEQFGLSVEEQQDCTRHIEDARLARRQYYTPIWEVRSEEYHHEEEEEDEDVWEEEASQGEPIYPTRYRAYMGHHAQVYSLAWSPNGREIISGSRDGNVHLWEAETGKTRLVLQDQRPSVNAVAWSPLGDAVASAGNDGMVTVWNAQSGASLLTYQGHQGWIFRGLAWSPDGTRLASASWDGTVHIWEATTGRTQTIYRGHHGLVYCLAWSPDGKRVASGGGYPDCTVQIWDATTGTRERTYVSHTEDRMRERPLRRGVDRYEEEWVRGASSVHSIAWSPNGLWVASAGLRSTCFVWDARTGQEIVTIPLPTDKQCEALVWTPDSHYLLSPQFLGAGVFLWHAHSNTIIADFAIHGLGDITALALSPDGVHAAAGGSSGAIRIWRIIGPF